MNLYDVRQAQATSRPEPLKTITNLVHPCSQLLFNHSSEILSCVSKYGQKAIKLVSCYFIVPIHDSVFSLNVVKLISLLLTDADLA